MQYTYMLTKPAQRVKVLNASDQFYAHLAFHTRLYSGKHSLVLEIKKRQN